MLFLLALLAPIDVVVVVASTKTNHLKYSGRINAMEEPGTFHYILILSYTILIQVMSLSVCRNYDPYHPHSP